MAGTRHALACGQHDRENTQARQATGGVEQEVPQGEKISSAEWRLWGHAIRAGGATKDILLWKNLGCTHGARHAARFNRHFRHAGEEWFTEAQDSTEWRRPEQAFVALLTHHGASGKQPQLTNLARIHRGGGWGGGGGGDAHQQTTTTTITGAPPCHHCEGHQLTRESKQTAARGGAQHSERVGAPSSDSF